MFEDVIIISGDSNWCLREIDRRPLDTMKNDYSRKGLIIWLLGKTKWRKIWVHLL